MKDTEQEEKSEEETPPLQIDPKCFQDALRAFFQPIKTNDSRLDFYTMYKRESTEYDTDYVKKYDEDLNTTLIFAGLFSAVSSAFVIDVGSNLQPDPDQESAALLRAIPLTLNQSAIPGETPTVPPIRGGPPSDIVAATCLMYASLLISLLAAFVAMLGKQWLNRYLRNSGGSMIERCGDRQRKCDGLEKWPLHFFIESLPVMLQAALLLLACGLCRYMWSVNPFVAYTLITLTGFGVVFYVGIVVAGMTSYACPFQTPASVPLRGLRKKVWDGTVSCIVRSGWAFSRARLVWNRNILPFFHRQSLESVPPENVQVERSESSPEVDDARQSEPWVKPRDLAITRRINTNDLRCVSWILRNITDQEALDAAIRLAGEIRWFDNGIDVDLPYDLVVCIFKACFDSTGKLYPGSRDRAYYSGRAIVWIRTLAMCKSQGFASRFPFHTTEYAAPSLDPDLEHLLQVGLRGWSDWLCAVDLLKISPEHTPSHSQWISDVLLHHCWADHAKLDHQLVLYGISDAIATVTTIPLNAGLNRLLAWCIFLGLPAKAGVLEIRGKSDCLEPILHQLSKAVLSAIRGTDTQRRFISHALHDLIKLESRPWCLTRIAYEWCSAICESHQNLWDWESLVLACLEIGFRHLDVQDSYSIDLTHTEHQELANVVLKSQNSEAIADFFHALAIPDTLLEPAHPLLGFYIEHLVSLQNLVPSSSSSRLRRLIIRSIEFIGYEGFEGAGVERFVQLLNHLRVTVEDMDFKSNWAGLLLKTLRSSEAVQHLSYWYWELLVELAIYTSQQWWRQFRIYYAPQITAFLIEAHEWGKLECWIGTVWMVWPPEDSGATEEDLEHLMLLLSRQRPGSAQKIEEWMERWSRQRKQHIPELFQRLCKQAHEAAQREAPSVSPINEATEEPARSSPSGDNEFWESLSYHAF